MPLRSETCNAFRRRLSGYVLAMPNMRLFSGGTSGATELIECKVLGQTRRMSHNLTIDELKAASDAFYVALAGVLAGDGEQMLQLWSAADDVCFMGPMGDLVAGAKAVRDAWQAQADSAIGGSVFPTDLRLVVGGPIGIVTNWEHGSGHEGVDHDVRIRATSTYRREGDAVRMIGHHTDLIV